MNAVAEFMEAFCKACVYDRLSCQMMEALDNMKADMVKLKQVRCISALAHASQRDPCKA